MSRSSSSQATHNNYTTTNTSNVLDGGAIRESFRFADNASDNARRSVDAALDATRRVSGEALDANRKVSESAFDFASDLSKNSIGAVSEALESNAELSSAALTKMAGIQANAFSVVEELSTDAVGALKAQNTLALSSLSAMQDSNAASNTKQLDTMTSLVKSVQTQGATELIQANQKTTIAIAVVLVVGVVILAMRGKR